MHDFVAKEISSIYSSYDGWKITGHPINNGYDRIAVLERRNNGHRECVRLLVTFSRHVEPEAFAELTVSEKSGDGTLTRNSAAVLMPGNANISSVPPGIKLYTMKSFVFDGSELAWTRKPVRKEEGEKSAA